MNHVLDIDLDLFQTDRATNQPRSMTERLDGNAKYPTLQPWTCAKLREFLARCGLCPGKPVPGKFIVHHDEAFGCLRDLINAGQLIPPFDLVHADTHADLGCGDGSSQYVVLNLLHRPVEERAFPKLRYQDPHDRIGDLDGLSEGNYLLFAIACRWLRSLVYVHHPSCFKDLPMIFFPEGVPEEGVLRLPVLQSDQVQTHEGVHKALKRGVEPLRWEPEVHFRRVCCDSYSENRPFDFAFVSHSPSYTHSSTDDLLPILRKYIVDTSCRG